MYKMQRLFFLSTYMFKHSVNLIRNKWKHITTLTLHGAPPTLWVPAAAVQGPDLKSRSSLHWQGSYCLVFPSALPKGSTFFIFEQSFSTKWNYFAVSWSYIHAAKPRRNVFRIVCWDTGIWRHVLPRVPQSWCLVKHCMWLAKGFVTMLTIHEKRDMIGYYVENIIEYFSFFCIFSSPVRRTESYSDTPGVSVSVSMSVKMLKFLV